MIDDNKISNLISMVNIPLKSSYRDDVRNNGTTIVRNLGHH